MVDIITALLHSRKYRNRGVVFHDELSCGCVSLASISTSSLRCLVLHTALLAVLKS